MTDWPSLAAHTLTMVMMTMVTIMITIMVSVPALADWSPKWRAYDGDSITATFRLANVDTPEIAGACEREKRLALEARDFTRKWIGNWRGVTVEAEGLGKYGRVIVRIRRGDDDLGEALIAKGLGRKWTGKRGGGC